MKFLEKIIDAIDLQIEALVHKLKKLIPHSFYDLLSKSKELPYIFKKKLKVYGEKAQIIKLKAIGYTQHYITIIRGVITEFFIYLRSEEFKKDKVKSLITNPFNYLKANPKKVAMVFSISAIFVGSSYIIGKNFFVILGGTKSRAPASKEIEYVDPKIVEIENIKFHLHLTSGGGGHGSAKEEAASPEIKTNLNLHAIDEATAHTLHEMHEKIHHELHEFNFEATSVPVNEQEIKTAETKLLAFLNSKLSSEHHPLLTKIEIKVKLSPRPSYYRINERSYSMKNVDLQLFQEDLNRNHQVYIDFTLIASNRNIILFLKGNEAMVRNQLSTNVEPILPRLPAEDEGKRIIKDKIRDEINDLLKKENIEGKILEVYLDFSLSS